ncbi:MAG: hypothetical protein RLY31_3238 [Bacteroidota bacterium]|jgi:inhibitor of KinA sporulation pathway (predicted exonuclease)
MNFILFDLEATCWDGMPVDMVQEIIEIGAVRINPYGEVTGAFNRFVRPVLHPTLSHFCKSLTSIDQLSVNRADTFPRVAEDFRYWAEAEEDEEECLYCSWGSFDRRMILQDAHLHRLETDWFEGRHLNIRRQYHEIRGWNNYRGLKKVVELEGFEFTGVYHRAISDAENLSKIFIKYIDLWRY